MASIPKADARSTVKEEPANPLRSAIGRFNTGRSFGPAETETGKTNNSNQNLRTADENIKLNWEQWIARKKISKTAPPESIPQFGC
jgi:hypothetical protein